ncbi:rRNA methyltransferase 3, mitochondrial [Cataglyphis hispanica]|uniref:rRNA methyltransferase 3, mitochondrial n=1 Tax=Cataglyphis hispanica TaxID=1086592 RepID=UPI00217F8C7F|nr:rRNA methyltransferase 3, mitochondrial [Cataglyphis hispanica]XP_050453899.1 rRNA methyltransferase 3, mitochondrial [Cataglyphis hispanica]
MLLNAVQLSIRSICGINLLRSINLRPNIKCRYTRWASRSPVAIVNEHELFDETTDTKTTKTKIPEKAFKTRKEKFKTRKEKSKTQKGKEKKKQEIQNKVGETITTEQGYKCIKADDRLISSLMIDVKTRNKREKNNNMLLEGFRLIKDAVEAGTKPKAIFFNRISEILPLSLSKEVKLYKVPYRTIQLWSNLTTSPGILGIFEIPDVTAKQPTDNAIPLTIICDNIRDPGNLGTIVRAAAAVGCEKLLLMKGCTDLWDTKVLRSAVGAHFRIPIHTSVLWDEIPTLISNESMMFLADNNITYENKLKDNMVNAESDVSTFIEADDNNMKQDNYDANNGQIVENDKSEDAIDELVDKNKSHKPTAKTKLLVKKLISQLPVEPYYTLDFTKKEIVLVIGGETEGVSLESCKLLHARNCIRVNVPLTNGIDSLNVGVAVGIVTFEMKRQFMTKNIDDK